MLEERAALERETALLEFFGPLWPSAPHDLARPDLGVTAKQVTAFDATFEGAVGDQFKKLVEWAAAEAGVNPGLLAAVMIAETARSDYLTKKKVSSFTIGTDDYYAKRHDIARKVPAHAKVNWDRKRGPYADTNEQNRVVQSIDFMTGRDAALASAVYLKHGEEVLRAAAKAAGGDFDGLPIEVRLALLRVAFQGGHGAGRKYLRSALKGDDILIRKPQKKAGLRRKATIRAAQAMHLSQHVFGVVPK
jgi:hypothetical protein